MYTRLNGWFFMTLRYAFKYCCKTFNLMAVHCPPNSFGMFISPYPAHLFDLITNKCIHYYFLCLLGICPETGHNFSKNLLAQLPSFVSHVPYRRTECVSFDGQTNGEQTAIPLLVSTGSCGTIRPECALNCRFQICLCALRRSKAGGNVATVIPIPHIIRFCHDDPIRSITKSAYPKIFSIQCDSGSKSGARCDTRLSIAPELCHRTCPGPHLRAFTSNSGMGRLQGFHFS